MKTGFMRFFVVAEIVIVMGVRPFTLEGGDTKGKQLKLARPNGTEIQVPTTGSSSNEDATQIATNVLDFDRQIRSFPKRRHSVDPKVLAAMREIALQSRNDAVEQLDLAQRISQETSGNGVWDRQLLQDAKQAIEWARQILNSSPPEHLIVETKISTSVSKARLHYCGAAEYRRPTPSWSSYDLGQRLTIGLYWFRVDAPQSQTEAFDEKVLVFDDPTVKTITPARGSP
jgi:hypothetical protein